MPTAETNPIATPLAYTNVSPFTQDIYVRVENIATECYNTTALNTYCKRASSAYTARSFRTL